MLERSRVEDQIRQGGPEDCAHRVKVANVSEDDLVALKQSLAGQAELRCVQAGLVTVEQVELLRAELGDLASEF
jgi:hypothetical protein